MNNNIENTLETLSNETIDTTHVEPFFYLNPEFWVGVAFVLVVILIYKPAYRIIKDKINARINRIKSEFQKAETLKLDAQSAYAKYERKLLNVEKEIGEIIKREELVIDELKEQKIKDLNLKLKQKQKEYDGKINLAIENTQKEVNVLIINKSIDILNDTFKSKLTKANYNNLIDKSISNLSNLSIRN